MSNGDQDHLGNSTPAGSVGATLVAVALGVAFLLIQLWTVDYGTRINDAPPIQQYVFAPGSGTSMEESLSHQETVIGDEVIAESVEKQMMRFKLYSVDPDEHMSIAALQRIRPAEFDFDPDYFQYGGGFLYPLGFVFFAMVQLGVIEVSSLEAVLNSAAGLDLVYVVGRAFVLIAFTLSAVILYGALRLVADPWSSTWAIGIYLFVPASLIYSVQIKPHWFWLLWIAAALFVFTRGWTGGRFGLRDELLLGVFIGLTVGASPMNAVPALLAGGAIVVAVWRGDMDWRGLVRIPLIAGMIAFLSSPYFFVSWRKFSLEAAGTTKGLGPTFDPIVVLNYVTSPLILGFGLPLVALLFGLSIYRLWARRGPMELWAVALLVGIIALVSILTAEIVDPELHFRYISYFLPIAVLLAARKPWPFRKHALAGIFILTVLQSVPIKLAYLDENDPARSTRLRAAAWITEEIAPGARLCSRKYAAPTTLPPIDLTKYRAVETDCDYHVESVSSVAAIGERDGYERIKVFVPRFSNRWFPVVFGFVNPHIAIHGRINGSVSAQQPDSAKE